MRAVVLILVLALAAAGPPAAQAASALATAGRASAAVDFSVVIPASLRTRLSQPPGQLVLGGADLERGRIEHSAALDIACNVRRALALAVAFDARLVARVEIEVAGRLFEVDNPGRSLRLEIVGPIRATLPVHYRIYLAPGVHAGRYGWPLAVQVGADDP